IYNHFAQEISVRIVDLIGRTVKVIQPQTTLANGIHSYDFESGKYSTGTYFIRMATFSSTGSQNDVQDLRFIVLN
ncbi:MAG: hypothetical protein ABI778_11715, partial [Ignavibacteriota bacterium]